MQLSEVVNIVSPELDLVEEEIENNIRSEIPLVYEISRYILGSGGKRIRPCILLLSCGACGLGDGAGRIRSAAALELIHTASLLHDDVVDRATLRRGKTSANVVWGNDASVLVGDFMLAKALNLINSCGNIELIDSVTRAAEKLAEGQVLEVMSSHRLTDFTEELCFEVIEHKTASLIESCGEVGAILSGAGLEARRALGSYAKNLGIAFQITDDALDYSADEREFGKTVGQDLQERKMTLPLVYSIRRAQGEERDRALSIFASEELGADDLDFVFNVVARYGGVEECIRVAREYADKAKASVSSLPESQYKEALLGLSDFIKKRRR